MRTESVADFKTKNRGGADSKHDLPKEGTAIRQVYDLLRANAGHVIKFDEMTKKQHASFVGAIEQLKLFYGCDIMCVSPRGKHDTARQYILTGEWIGAHYADYVLMREQGKL